METAFERTISLIGEQKFDKLMQANVLVVGLGGVGGAAAETLVRSGVGKLSFVDGDVFESTNLNRQLLCTLNEIGKNKAEAACERALSIVSDADVTAVPQYITQNNAAELLSVKFDYCVDAIDDLKNKVLLVSECKRRGIRIISAMGAGNRLDCGFAVCDVFETKDDPFARKFRRELKAVGVTDLDVVCATSPPYIKACIPASIAAPPLVMGAMLASHVVRRLIEQ